MNPFRPQVHGMTVSGNCYKIQLVAAQLGIEYDWHEVDILKGESRTPEYLAMNPNGKVPVVEVEPGEYLSESNAILCYFGEGTALLPAGRLERARVLEWMFFEQYSHEPCVAVARFVSRFLPADHPRRAELPGLIERGNAALAVMESQLKAQDFFAPGGYSLADIALYAYTHNAGEAGFDLGAYPAVQAWLARTRAQPGHVPMGVQTGEPG